MRAAVSTGKYQYYHLISGQDLPLMNQQRFHDFFEGNNGESYLELNWDFEYEQFVKRIGRYYFFQNRIGRERQHLNGIVYIIQKISLLIQKMMFIDRTKYCPYKLYKGANWFSLTDEMVKYVLSKERDIFQYFSKSFCADEIFLQTILMNSPYADNIINNSMRAIDWERGGPYTYTIDDYELLVSSSKLFGRKFSTETDSAIINMICKNNGVTLI